MEHELLAQETAALPYRYLIRKAIKHGFTCRTAFPEAAAPLSGLQNPKTARSRSPGKQRATGVFPLISYVTVAGR